MEERELSLYHRTQQLHKEYHNERDPERKKKIRNGLVYLYVQFGEYFKMSMTPNYEEAKRYLKKALKYEFDHPVAHYRLAHIYYNEGKYHDAAYHFSRALTGTIDKQLNDTQKALSHLMLINCGIEIASRALRDYHANVQRGVYFYDEDLVEHYQKAIYLTDIGEFKRGLYRIITPNRDGIVAEQTYFEQQDQCSPHEVILTYEKGNHAGDDKLAIKFQNQRIELDYKEFYLLAFLLHNEHPLTIDEIQEAFFKGFLKEDAKEDAIRKKFQRLKEIIPFWNEIIEETSIERKVGRKRKDGVSYRIFCRASDIFPWENNDDF